MANAQKIEFTAEKREGTGKGVARALRRENKVPAVIYGDNKDPVTISLSANEVLREFYKGGLFNNLTQITLDGKKHVVLARDIQVDYIAEKVIHADFLRVSAKTRIDVAVPVEFLNEESCPGLKRGGTLAVVRFDVELNCRATEIPEKIEIDLTPFGMGDAIKISNVDLPDGVTPTIDDRDFTIATIAAPKGGSDADEDQDEAAEGEADEASAEGEAA